VFLCTLRGIPADLPLAFVVRVFGACMSTDAADDDVAWAAPVGHVVIAIDSTQTCAFGVWAGLAVCMQC
jgi:hypothetical protein